jgi:hypothetical protein
LFPHDKFKFPSLGEHPRRVSFAWFVGKVAVGKLPDKPTNKNACANRDARKARVCCGNSHIAMKLKLRACGGQMI